MTQIYSLLITAFGVLFLFVLNKQRSMLLIPLSVIERKRRRIELPSCLSETTRSKQSGAVRDGAPVA